MLPTGLPRDDHQALRPRGPPSGSRNHLAARRDRPRLARGLRIPYGRSLSSGHSDRRSCEYNARPGLHRTAHRDCSSERRGPHEPERLVEQLRSVHCFGQPVGPRNRVGLRRRRDHCDQRWGRRNSHGRGPKATRVYRRWGISYLRIDARGHCILLGPGKHWATRKRLL